MGKFLKNIAVFLKDMMGVLLLLWPSCYPVMPFLSLKTERPTYRVFPLLPGYRFCQQTWFYLCKPFVQGIIYLSKRVLSDYWPNSHIAYATRFISVFPFHIIPFTPGIFCH